MSNKNLSFTVKREEITIKKILFSIATCAVLFTGCGGGGGSSSGGTTTDNKSTGYFIDSGVEGLMYKIDGTSYYTGNGGSLKCEVGKDKLQFYIGDKALGNEVNCAAQITPEKLIDETLTKDNYSSNEDAINVMRLLQSLDDDENPENGITITSDTHTKIKNSVHGLALDSVSVLDSLIQDVSSGRLLVARASAMSHYNNSMFLIANKYSGSITEKQELFNKYSNGYFSVLTTKIQNKTVSQKEYTLAISDAVKTVVDYIAIDTTNGVKIVISDTIKEVLKDAVSANMQGAKKEYINLAIEISASMIKYKLDPNNKSKTAKELIDSQLELAATALTGTVSTTFNTIKDDTNKMQNLKDMIYVVSETLALAINSLDAMKGNPTALIAQSMSSITNGVNTSFQEFYALENEEALLSKVTIPRNYLRLWYLNGETQSGVAIALGLSRTASSDDIYNKISSANGGQSGTILSGLIQWATGTEDLEHVPSDVYASILAFKNSFERRLALKKAIIDDTSSGTCNNNQNFIYKTITSSTTGKVWMDRNLGSSKVCTSYNDSSCYGDYYQWGRCADGHEKSNSSTTSTQATNTSSVGHGDFITSSSNYDYDWANNADSDGTTRQANWNPCPSGYRIPTINELLAESIDDRADAYSKLKLPSAGYRSGYDDGSMGGQGSDGYLWSSSLNGSNSKYLYFNSSFAYSYYSSRAYGHSVRCVRD
jgi:hypothetical protein